MSKSAEIHVLRSESDKLPRSRTGVSLHCHTLHSKEILDFIPHYAERLPVVKWFWHRAMQRRQEANGTTPDFTKGYWEPPLDGRSVIASETAALAKVGLDPIVSITDHDSIAAVTGGEHTFDHRNAPVSLEWTVPFRRAFFHIGVHNLPKTTAGEIFDQLMAYTYAAGIPDEERLTELLTMLSEHRDVLVVLNHPIWDIEMIGQERHESAMMEFVRKYSPLIHALEVNGFRAWKENCEVVELAERFNLPVVSGGDRHCCQANTVINITDAATFSEFADEVRTDRHSRIAVMPDYHAPLPTRQLRSIRQILANAAEYGHDRRQWIDRVFIDAGDGRGVSSLSEIWNGRAPLWASAALWTVAILSHSALRPAIDLLVGDIDIGRSENKPNDAMQLIPNASTPFSEPF